MDPNGPVTASSASMGTPFSGTESGSLGPTGPVLGDTVKGFTAVIC